MIDAQRKTPIRWTIIWGVATVAVSFLAYHEVQRIENGHLFAFAFPRELPPTDVERIDARLSAAQYKYVAAIAVVVIGFALPGVCKFAATAPKTNFPRLLGGLFAAAVFADLVTTIRFFHSSGIEHELHPAIRLFGYAYGRTMGPLLGKGVQAVGVILIGRSMGRYGFLLIATVTLVYFLAAVYNFAHAG